MSAAALADDDVLFAHAGPVCDIHPRHQDHGARLDTLLIDDGRGDREAARLRGRRSAREGSGPFFTQNGSEYYPKMCIHIEKSGVFFGVFWCILVRIHTVSVFLRNTLYSAWNTHEYRCILCILPPRVFCRVYPRHVSMCILLCILSVF